MLFAARESAVTKKPRLRFTMRRSSSVRPRGSFHSWMSRLMLISCGIQWLAQAARYFSHAHLYLKGTSWLTSDFELITSLSSTVTRRSACGSGFACSFAGLAGTNPVAGCSPRPGIMPSLPSSSKLSIASSSVLLCAQRPGEQHRAERGHLVRMRRGRELGPVFARGGCCGRLALRPGREGHLVGGHVQVPL